MNAIRIKAHGFPDLFEQVAAIARTAVPRPIVFDTAKSRQENIDDAARASSDSQARIIAHAVNMADQERNRHEN